MSRLQKHPILPVPIRNDIAFTFDGRTVIGKDGEMIASALYAADIHVFGHHAKDGAPQGIYCANGQCSQCTVIADGLPVKACMTPVHAGMRLLPCNGLPALPADDAPVPLREPEIIETDCLIIGGGPAGLSAAIELGKSGIRTILADDKFELGGKLTLQTHKFFGSRDDCFAGTRGFSIAKILEEQLAPYRGSIVDVWLNSPAIGVFYDGLAGIVRHGTYTLVRPKTLLVAAGAREKTLAFPGCDLPGVYGAGAFQTLVNRDLVKPAEKLFICGGGNVGLIGAYHAIQAGITVAGLVEALPECGGYKVHADKIKRLGVPIFTSHTILAAHGKVHLERITMAAVDKSFKVVPDTQKTFEVDTLLVAVGLAPVNEFIAKARAYGMKVFAAGDAEEIAEASAAMFSGRIQGRTIAATFTKEEFSPQELQANMEVLRSRPGRTISHSDPGIAGKVYPIIRCNQEIPCNPCRDSCPKGSIQMEDNRMTGIPRFCGANCIGCAQCVLVCPGLAITLVDESYDKEGRKALLTLPYELPENHVQKGDEVITVDSDGKAVGKGIAASILLTKKQDSCALLKVEVPFEDRLLVAGIRLPWPDKTPSVDATVQDMDTIVCRCERITKREIVEFIQAGYRDTNHIKAALRTGMGACNGKNCTELVMRIFLEQGVDLAEVTSPTIRVPATEIPLGIFAGLRGG